MTSSEIIAAVRFEIREPSAQRVSDTYITSVITRGIKQLGLAIKKANPEFCERRTLLDSETNIFDWPSSCLQIRNVFDYRESAITITGATNASPIVISAASHSMSDGDIVHVQGVGGNTAANDIWEVDNSDDDTLELKGSTGDGEYTSGGLLWKEKKNLKLITRLGSRNSHMGNKCVWFPRGKKIVIDSDDFTNDIIVDYIMQFSEVTDIPDDYHDGLIAYCVINTLVLPPKNSPEYDDKFQVLNRMTGILNATYKDIQDLKVSSEPQRFPSGISWNAMMT